MKRATSRDGFFDCIESLDYPALADDLWIIWTHSGKWPDPDRTLRYLSRSQTSVTGFALLTSNHRDAMRFDNEGAARQWLSDQNAMRAQPWNGLRVSTVAAMKLAHGFYVEEAN